MLKYRKASNASGMPKITKAIIAVAGFGTRFLPATKVQPKEMLPLIDRPIVQYLVEEAVASGIKEVILGKNRIDSLRINIDKKHKSKL